MVDHIIDHTSVSSSNPLSEFTYQTLPRHQRARIDQSSILSPRSITMAYHGADPAGFQYTYNQQRSSPHLTGDCLLAQPRDHANTTDALANGWANMSSTFPNGFITQNQGADGTADPLSFFQRHKKAIVIQILVATLMSTAVGFAVFYLTMSEMLEFNPTLKS